MSLDQAKELLKRAQEAETRLRAIEIELGEPEVLRSPARLRDLGRERAEIEPVVQAAATLQRLVKAIDEAEEITRTSRDDEFLELARAELESARAALPGEVENLRALLVPSDPTDDKNAIIEIRAGTGGQEAALFAADLYRMYQRYLEDHGFGIEMMSLSPTGIGGIKEVIIMARGRGAFGRLRQESGVHRVQRVPATEASGRIHTSAVTVAVLPEAEEVEVAIAPEDIRVDVYRSSGPGGQGVNTTDSAVRITHLPTGLVVTCQDERSQIKNRAKALAVLRARLLDRRRREEEERISEMRRAQVSTGDRSARIRTYNFPQGRVTDHRVGLTLYRLPEILEGDLDELITALASARDEDRLEESREDGEDGN
jgi:peptide chain release factor 1